jgi:ABC-type bacteriocin/lantibiotic exporter with double-glycine peptidase domain
LLNPEPHFAVLLGMDETYVYLADPAIGNMTLRREAFLKRWLFPGADQGYVFIAMSPDGRVNSDLQKRVLGELAQGLRNLETMRPQLPLLRR